MKKIKFLSLSLISVLLLCGTSCSNDTDLDDFSKTAVPENNQKCKICTFDLVNADLFGESDTLSQKAVLTRRTKWRNGETITIKFLNGNAYLQSKVKKYASEWLKYANLKFEYVTGNQDTDIRVAFGWDGDDGSWSYVGNYCRYISQNEPTINFGWFTNSTDEEDFKSTVLHEFGHALGLEHEHQHPKNNIKWNKPVVYAYYAQQGWGKSQVDFNIFKKLSRTQTNYSAYDKYSIMHYAIPANHTTNGFSVGWNIDLSKTDIQFIKNQYPK